VISLAATLAVKRLARSREHTQELPHDRQQFVLQRGIEAGKLMTAPGDSENGSRPSRIFDVPAQQA
jgi:hypothetical protein